MSFCECSADIFILLRFISKTEYCEKGNLHRCMKEGLHKDEQRVWQFFREMCEGLSYLHKNVSSKCVQFRTMLILIGTIILIYITLKLEQLKF